MALSLTLSFKTYIFISNPAKPGLTSKLTALRPPGSNTMVSSLDTLDAVTAVQMESLEHQSSEHYSHDYEVHEPDSDTERLVSISEALILNDFKVSVFFGAISVPFSMYKCRRNLLTIYISRNNLQLFPCSRQCQIIFGDSQNESLEIFAPAVRAS